MHPVAEFALDSESLLERAPRFAGVAGLAQRLADIAQHQRFPARLVEVAEDREALPEVGNGIVETAPPQPQQTKGVGRHGLPEPVADLAADLQRDQVVLLHLGQPARLEVRLAEAFQHLRLAVAVPRGTSRRQPDLSRGEPVLEHVLVHEDAAEHSRELPGRLVQAVLARGPRGRDQVVAFHLDTAHGRFTLQG
ncbi:hypothetical protein GCM10022402_27860 [Salinactinospora qingdaonensis]|uniref:Uncharacterized protein n=1 Tax=Salinactinospora qingdaonensis TaxID=702744 RepID=A0ABP7FS17_9ACTN